MRPAVNVHSRGDRLLTASAAPLIVVLALACTDRLPEPDPEPPPDHDVIAFTGVTVIPMRGSTGPDGLSRSGPSSRASSGAASSEPGAAALEVLERSDRVLPDHTVLVERGRITAVGPAAEVEVPAGALRIGGRGRFLLPGLADMHVHLERFERPSVLHLFVAQGVTTVRNMDGRPYLLDWRRRVEEGSLLGPSMVTAGPILEGTNPFWDDTRVVETSDEAAAAVAEQEDAGYDFAKVYHTLSEPAYEAVLAEAEERGLQVAGHVPNGVPYEEILSGGQDAVSHLDGLLDVVEAEDSPYRDGWNWRKLFFAVPIDETKLREAARATAEVGLWHCPTLVVNAQIAPVEELYERLEDSRLDALPRGLVKSWHPTNVPMIDQLDEEDFRALREGEENRLRAVAALHRAGAPLLAGTDTPNPFVLPGHAIHEELAHFVAAGLTPYQALATATRDAARFLGEEGEWGSIAPGLRGDLLLLDANPLEDIVHTTRIAGVLVGGRWLPAEELERRERAIAERE